MSWARLLAGTLKYPDPDYIGQTRSQAINNHVRNVAAFPRKRVQLVRALSDADLLAQCIRDKGLPITRYATEVLLCDPWSVHRWLGDRKIPLHKRHFLELSRLYTLSQRKDRRRDP